MNTSQFRNKQDPYRIQNQMDSLCYGSVPMVSGDSRSIQNGRMQPNAQQTAFRVPATTMVQQSYPTQFQHMAQPPSSYRHPSDQTSVMDHMSHQMANCYIQPEATPSSTFSLPPGTDGCVYRVRFKRYAKHYIRMMQYMEPLTVGEYVKVEADRGYDVGRIDGVLRPDEYTESYVNSNSLSWGFTSSLYEVKRILGRATPAEIDDLNNKGIEEASVLEVCRSKSKQRCLPMRVVDAEYQFDRHKLTFYFIAEGRIDFRELVRDLFAIYKARIWLQQLMMEQSEIDYVTSTAPYRIPIKSKPIPTPTPTLNVPIPHPAKQLQPLEPINDQFYTWIDQLLSCDSTISPARSNSHHQSSSPPTPPQTEPSSLGFDPQGTQGVLESIAMNITFHSPRSATPDHISHGFQFDEGFPFLFEPEKHSNHHGTQAHQYLTTLPPYPTNYPSQPFHSSTKKDSKSVAPFSNNWDVNNCSLELTQERK